MRNMSKHWGEEFVYEPGKTVPDVVRVIIPGTTEEIPTNAFRHHRAMQEAVLKEGVIEIGENAFIRCEALKHVDLPSTLVRIGKCAFGGTSLRELNLPENITELGPYSFARCVHLREVIFPNGIRSVKDGAFKCCKLLENVVLPFTMNTIRHHAFAHCNSLKMVQLTGSVQIILREAFHQCNSLEHISVPCKSLVITWKDGHENFDLVRDSFPPPAWGEKKLVITSECFSSICLTDMSNIETAITEIIGVEIMPFETSWPCYEWDEKCQRICAMLNPHKKQCKNQIASLLELGLWKANMKKTDDEADSRVRAEHRPNHGVEMIQENVLSFLHFL